MFDSCNVPLLYHPLLQVVPLLSGKTKDVRLTVVTPRTPESTSISALINKSERDPGAAKVQDDIKKKLFDMAAPFTSRPMLEHELQGREYNFVTAEEFQKLIDHNRCDRGRHRVNGVTWIVGAVLCTGCGGGFARDAPRWPFLFAPWHCFSFIHSFIRMRTDWTPLTRPPSPPPFFSMIEYGRNADGHFYGTLKPTAEMASKENRRLRRSTFQSEGASPA